MCKWWQATSRNSSPVWSDTWSAQGGTPSTSSRTAQVDLVVVGFCAAFLLIHALVSFQVWDRYMLGLVPLLVLVLARVLHGGWQLAMAVMDTVAARKQLTRAIVTAAAMILLMSLLVGPVQDAAASRLPVGGDHGAYEGVDQVVAFLRTVPADTTLYHRWLGGHWRFYLWSNPYDFRYWETEVDLARQAADRPGADRYVVFPSWQSPTETGLALEARGLVLEEAHRALRADGSVSFRVFRIEEAE